MLLSLAPRKPAHYFKPIKPLKDYLPGSSDGWIAEDHSLGATEYQTERAKNILKLDDFAFRSYRRGTVQFAIYWAYWAPGSQNTIDVGFHNPDVCWSANGWTTSDDGKSQAFPLHDVWLKPGQVRRFEREGTVQYVIFWHVKGGQLSGHAMGERSNYFNRIYYNFKCLTREMISWRDSEQFFIRLSANVPLDTLISEKKLQAAMGAVCGVGLLPVNP